MTATDELRKLLDERGVEWGSYDEFEPRTQWEAHDGAFVYWARERNGMLLVETTAPEKCSLSMTPEQAIAATLERETCRITVQDNMAETKGMGDVWLECDTCGFQMPLEPSTPRFNFCPNCGRRIVEGDE